MLDIIEYDGQPALKINNTLIGTEQDILQLQKEKEEYKQLFFEMKGLYDELTSKIGGEQ